MKDGSGKAFREMKKLQEIMKMLGNKVELVINIDDRGASCQAIIDTLEANRIKVEYELGRFRIAFREATASLVARNKTAPYEWTKSLCYRLNQEYNLYGKRTLRRCFVEEATMARVAFVVLALRSAPRDCSPPPQRDTSPPSQNQKTWSTIGK